MSIPSPFEMGRAIGGNVSGAVRGAQENSQLDNILQQAMESKDQNFQNDVLRQILTRVSPEKRPGALEALQNRSQQLQKQSQRSALVSEGYNPDLPESILKEQAKDRNKQSADDISKKENIERAKQSLNLINRGREILGTGHLGPKFGIGGTGRKAKSTLSAEGRALRAEYARIGKALVQAAAPLKITNRAEFLHYAEGLDDPDLTREQIKGNLDAMERIVMSSLEEQREPRGQSGIQTEPSNNSEQSRPPLTSFIR